MAIEEGFFEASDGIRLYYRFQGGQDLGAPILLVHGHGEHSGRYLKFFNHLEELHRPIAIFDLRGCGRSEGRRVYVERFEDYLGDLTSFVDFLKKRYQISGPLHLFGHSLGGLIATAWACRNQGLMKKLILSSPLFGIPLGGLVKRLVPFLNWAAPRFVVRNPVRPPFLTHDPEEVERYQKDPLIQRRITVRLTSEMLRMAHFFETNQTRVPFPVHILMAGEDYVVDPEATRRFAARLEAAKKTVESFPGFYHEIFNERGQEKVFDRLRDLLREGDCNRGGGR